MSAESAEHGYMLRVAKISKADDSMLHSYWRKTLSLIVLACSSSASLPRTIVPPRMPISSESTTASDDALLLQLLQRVCSTEISIGLAANFRSLPLRGFKGLS